MPEQVTLVCWQCGARKDIEVTRLPQFAFELAHMADQVGWMGAIDVQHSRSLVFCTQKCMNKARTKYGSFRMHPKKEGQS